MAIIHVQKIPKKSIHAEEIIARFCYYFPQYTFAQARFMPYKRIKQMLDVVRKEQAQQYAVLTNIIASPHTKRGEGIKKMIKYFNDIIEGNA